MYTIVDNIVALINYLIIEKNRLAEELNTIGDERQKERRTTSR